MTTDTRRTSTHNASRRIERTGPNGAATKGVPRCCRYGVGSSRPLATCARRLLGSDPRTPHLARAVGRRTCRIATYQFGGGSPELEARASVRCLLRELCGLPLVKSPLRFCSSRSARALGTPPHTTSAHWRPAIGPSTPAADDSNPPAAAPCRPSESNAPAEG